VKRELGRQAWTARAGSGVLSDLVMSESTVYYSTKSGDVEKVDPATGRLRAYKYRSSGSGQQDEVPRS